MRLENLSAVADPAGNKILLSWQYPQGTGISGVHIRRNTGTYPLSLSDGFEVVVAENQLSTTDSNLHEDTVYYYTFFPYLGDPGNIIIDRHNRTSTMVTAPMAYADYIYEMLPLLYHRYDTNLPPDSGAVDAADINKGQLRRFVEIIGGELDKFHSYARAVEDFHDTSKVDGQLLPTLAQWLGWRLDLKRELDEQRNEVRNAPSIYKTIGTIPTIQQTVKRISGWESKSKEFVHNIFRTNQPERLNLWQLVRSDTGLWSPQSELFSLDYAYEGRPSFVMDNHQLRWLFYHTQRNGAWEIWYKTTPTFELEMSVIELLAVGVVSEDVRLAFQQVEISLAADATVSQPGSLWQIEDVTNSHNYLIAQQNSNLIVYSLSEDETSYSPSKPLIRSVNINKYPSAALQGDTLWLFWSEYNTEHNVWQIHYQTHNDGAWSTVDPSETTSPFRTVDVVDSTTPRYKPNVVVDRLGDLWLFWLEQTTQGWSLKYNKHSGGSWGATAASLPAGRVGNFHIDADPSVLMANVSSGPQIYLFWSRNVATGSANQSRWQIDLQVKTDLNFDELNWHGVYTLPINSLDDGYHDREPMAVINTSNEIELFWSSNAEGNWAVWRRTLSSLDTTTDTLSWSVAERITQSVYSSRDPLAIALSDNRMLLLNRSNESLKGSSETYQAMQTLDARYAGSTTHHMRNFTKKNLRGEFDDFATYTFDTGRQGKRSDDNWYARDTVGLYLETDTMDDDRINSEIERLRSVVTEFLPVTDRAVYITSPDIHNEYVYSYGQPPSADSRFIVSTYHDEITSVLDESILAPDEDFTDSLL